MANYKWNIYNSCNINLCYSHTIHCTRCVLRRASSVSLTSSSARFLELSQARSGSAGRQEISRDEEAAKDEESASLTLSMPNALSLYIWVGNVINATTGWWQIHSIAAVQSGVPGKLTPLLNLLILVLTWIVPVVGMDDSFGEKRSVKRCPI